MITRILELDGSLADLFDLPPSRNVYYQWRDDEPNPWIAHYCLNIQKHGRTGEPRWLIAGTGLHTVESRQPLTLSPSIGWMQCCGRHGFIQGGLWVPAPPDLGWMPS